MRGPCIRWCQGLFAQDRSSTREWNFCWPTIVYAEHLPKVLTWLSDGFQAWGTTYRALEVSQGEVHYPYCPDLRRCVLWEGPTIVPIPGAPADNIILIVRLLTGGFPLFTGSNVGGLSSSYKVIKFMMLERLWVRTFAPWCYLVLESQATQVIHRFTTTIQGRPDRTKSPMIFLSTRNSWDSDAILRDLRMWRWS